MAFLILMGFIARWIDVPGIVTDNALAYPPPSKSAVASITPEPYPAPGNSVVVSTNSEPYPSPNEISTMTELREERCNELQSKLPTDHVVAV
jgi:hypothetical protein